MKKVYLHQKLSGDRIRCTTCSHYCVVSSGERGVCGVRENINGELYALNYARAVAFSADPVEKKPLFHFLPGTRTLSFSTVGCNMRCANCQNYEISQMHKKKREIPGREISPEMIVRTALANDIPSICCTYAEPVIFLEYALDTMKLAKQKGLRNAWVSNGYLSKESREMVIPYLDAINIDIKSFSDEFYVKNCGARILPVLETAKEMKKRGVWTEITTLVIPGLSDSEEDLQNIALFIMEELGDDVPWHVSRFTGAISWKLKEVSDTPTETMEKAYNIGKEVGLKYVYTGNLSGFKRENTFCPDCGEMIIERDGFRGVLNKEGECDKCGNNIPLVL